MDKLNEKFKYNDCEIEIRFTPMDKYGADRHIIFITRPMCPLFKAQSFAKNLEEVREDARQYTAFITPTCG